MTFLYLGLFFSLIPPILLDIDCHDHYLGESPNCAPDTDCITLFQSEYNGNSNSFLHNFTDTTGYAAFPLESHPDETIDHGICCPHANKRYQTRTEIEKAVLTIEENVKSTLVSLSDYKVELAIKNSEHKDVDESDENKSVEKDETDFLGFHIKLLKELHPDSVEAIEIFRVNLKKPNVLTPLQSWNLQNLSSHAAQKIANAESAEARGTLEKYSQNFQTLARALAKTTVSDKLREEVLLNRKMLEESSIDIGDTSLYINGFNQDNISLDLFKLADLLKQEDKLAELFHCMGINREYLSVLVRMDTSDDEKTSYVVDHREGYPFFINNLDTGKNDKQWDNSVKLMLQPYYPGMIRPIARNFFSLVFVVDPSTPEIRKFLRIGQTFNSHDIAMRIGYIFVVNQDPKVGGDTDLGVALLNLFNYVSIDSSNTDALKVLNAFLDNYRSQDPTVADLKEFFEGRYSDANFKEVFGVDSDYDKGRKHGYEFIQKTGLNSAPKVPLNGFILDEEGVRGDNIEETIMMELVKISPMIQSAIMEGKLIDRMNVRNWMLDQKEVMPQINKKILSAPPKKTYVDFLGPKECKRLEGTEILSEADRFACFLHTTKYFQKASADLIMPVTFGTIADAEFVDGRQFIYNSLQVLKNSAKTRVGIIFNPKNIKKACEANTISSYIRAALDYLSMDQAKRLILKLSNEEYAADFISGKMTFEDISVGGMDTTKFLDDKKKMDRERTRAEANFSKTLLNISAGDHVVDEKALQVGPLDNDERFQAENITDCDIKAVMNTKDKHSELPLKRYSRYAAASELSFDHTGNLNTKVVRFDNLSSKQLQTVFLQAPDSWIVEAVTSKYDLDNIKMKQASGDVAAVFKLQHLFIQGQCLDEISGQPPGGLQYVLGTDKNSKRFGTIAMADLGYFQLKANPGSWILEIREGKSSEVYEIGTHVGAKKIGKDTLQVVLDSFTGRSVRVCMEKREGMEERNVLSHEEEGVWSSRRNLISHVLFPLDVQKVIFVDADQVVRTDLMELMKFDIGIAPYEYVSFCENEQEMDGLRFWKQRHWAKHLAGRRFHISALYVIDLQKFRQIAARDCLRGQYQGLSEYPNSSANLDQDLPNNIIHQVRIKSLPQEWLWCETWCDDESKKNTKTFDWNSTSAQTANFFHNYQTEEHLIRDFFDGRQNGKRNFNKSNSDGAKTVFTAIGLVSLFAIIRGNFDDDNDMDQDLMEDGVSEVLRSSSGHIIATRPRHNPAPPPPSAPQEPTSPQISETESPPTSGSSTPTTEVLGLDDTLDSDSSESGSQVFQVVETKTGMTDLQDFPSRKRRKVTKDDEKVETDSKA